MNYKPNAKEVSENIKQKLARHFGTTPADATSEQLYKACAMTIKDIFRYCFRFNWKKPRSMMRVF